MARLRASMVSSMVALVLLLAGLGTAGLAAAGAGAAGAGAAGAHRALVIVETGSATYQQVVTFDADSITGIQALDLAGANPVVYTYSGQGGAVCRLFGVGRDAGPNCLGGADGDPRYWAYFRALSGTSAFTYSRAGAGSTQVHDGDVEGWHFSTGVKPAWAPVPPPTTTTTVAPPSPPAPAPGAGGTVTAPPPGATPQQLAAYLLALAAAGSTTTTTQPVAAEVRAKTASRPAHRRVAAGLTGTSGADGGNGAGSLAIFAIVAAALGGGVFLLRRSRRRGGLA